MGDGCGVGVVVGSATAGADGDGDGALDRDASGLSEGSGAAQAASPAALAAAPSWSSLRREIGAGCWCIGPLSADAPEVGVAEVGRQLQTVAERSIHADVRDEDRTEQGHRARSP